jgi:tryptophan 2,3-dioxygenase
VSRIFEQLNSAWDVLRTMAPSDFVRFRESLGRSSGFQSHLYRMIEFMLGNRDAARLAPHAHDESATAMLRAELAVPSLYDEALRLAQRCGVPIPPEVIHRDLSRAHAFHEAVVEAWHAVYEAPAIYGSLFELAEKLVDIEDYLRRWRFNHVTTVERVIGLKRGTGGTGGVPYLRKMLEVELFPELWRVRTVL